MLKKMAKINEKMKIHFNWMQIYFSGNFSSLLFHVDIHFMVICIVNIRLHSDAVNQANSTKIKSNQTIQRNYENECKLN